MRSEEKTVRGGEREPGWADFFSRGGVAVAGQGRSQGWQGWPNCFSTSFPSSFHSSFPSFYPSTKLLCSDELPGRALEQFGNFQKILPNELFCLEGRKLQRLSLHQEDLQCSWDCHPFFFTLCCTHWLSAPRQGRLFKLFFLFFLLCKLKSWQPFQ